MSVESLVFEKSNWPENGISHAVCASSSFLSEMFLHIVLRDKIPHRSRIVGGINRPATVARRVNKVTDAIRDGSIDEGSALDPFPVRTWRSNLDTKDIPNLADCLNMAAGLSRSPSTKKMSR